MSRKRIAIVASMLMTSWMPLGIATTATVGGAMAIGGCAGKADTRQDTRTEQRTEDRMEQRRD